MNDITESTVLLKSATASYLLLIKIKFVKKYHHK